MFQPVLQQEIQEVTGAPQQNNSPIMFIPTKAETFIRETTMVDGNRGRETTGNQPIRQEHVLQPEPAVLPARPVQVLQHDPQQVPELQQQDHLLNNHITGVNLTNRLQAGIEEQPGQQIPAVTLLLQDHQQEVMEAEPQEQVVVAFRAEVEEEDKPESSRFTAYKSLSTQEEGLFMHKSDS